MSCSANRRILIIGYGNPLRGDDGVGWHAVQRVARLVADGRLPAADWRTMTDHQLLPEHAEPISEADLVIFVDASVDDAPGMWRCREVAPTGDTGGVDSHALEAGDILALAERLYGRCPPAKLYTIGGADFSLGERLSELVEKAMGEVVEAIAAA